MLLQLQPEQVSKYWDAIKFALIDGLPPHEERTPETLNYILEALIVKDMICWASVIELEEMKYKLEGIVITQMLKDASTKTKNLLIYLVYSFEKDSKFASWVDGLDLIKKYARSIECTNIVAYTRNKQLAAFVSRMGGDSSWMFLKMPVGEENASQKMN
jgi:hypothetical protein